MNDLKKVIKLMRHAYGIKTNCIQAVVFIAIGAIHTLTGTMGRFGTAGGFFWICLPIVPTQLFYSLNVAQLVQSSPLRRRMQTGIPVMINGACMLLIYLLEASLLGAISLARPELAGEIGWLLIDMALMAGLVLVYLGICFKHFLAATLCMVPVMVAWMQGSIAAKKFLTGLSGGMDISFVLALFIGLGMVIVGGLAEYLLNLLFYRAPFSKMAQAAPLRKEL